MNINNIHNAQMSRWEALGTNLTLHATFNVLERSKNWLAGSKSGKHKVTWELNVKKIFYIKHEHTGYDCYLFFGVIWCSKESALMLGLAAASRLVNVIHMRPLIHIHGKRFNACIFRGFFSA